MVRGEKNKYFHKPCRARGNILLINTGAANTGTELSLGSRSCSAWGSGNATQDGSKSRTDGVCLLL